MTEPTNEPRALYVPPDASRVAHVSAATQRGCQTDKGPDGWPEYCACGEARIVVRVPADEDES
jgi:hypothetical protein